MAISNAISALVTLDEAKNSSITATTKPLFRAVEFDSFGNSKSMTLSKGSLGVSQPKNWWGSSESGNKNNMGNIASRVIITNTFVMDVPTTPTTYVQPNPPTSDLDYHPDLDVVKQVADTGSIIFGPGSYIDMPHFASAFLKYGREANSATLRGDENSYPQEFDDVVRKVCVDDIKNLVVRTTTNYEIDQCTIGRVISKTYCDQVPVENPPQPFNTPEYINVPQLPNSSWCNGALQYQAPTPVEEFSQSSSHSTMQTNLKTDQLGVNTGNMQPSVSMAITSPVATNEDVSVSGSIPYIPNIEPISPGFPEHDAPASLNDIVKLLGIAEIEEQDKVEMVN